MYFIRCFLVGLTAIVFLSCGASDELASPASTGNIKISLTVQEGITVDDAHMLHVRLYHHAPSGDAWLTDIADCIIDPRNSSSPVTVLFSEIGFSPAYVIAFVDDSGDGDLSALDHYVIYEAKGKNETPDGITIIFGATKNISLHVPLSRTWPDNI